MKTLTNQQMLAAAKRTLAEHLATRPATETEADAMRQRHLDAAERLEREAASMVYQPRTAAEIGRGPHAVAEQHREGIKAAQALQESLRLRAAAARERLHAAAWDCDSCAMAATWEATRAELQGRVDYYEGLAAK